MARHSGQGTPRIDRRKRSSLSSDGAQGVRVPREGRQGRREAERYGHARPRKADAAPGIHPGTLEQYKKPSGRKAPQHIAHVAPRPDSSQWESDDAYEKRVKRGSYVEEKVKRRHRKLGSVTIAIIVIAVVVAAAVGAFVFFKSTDSRLSVADESVSEALVAAEKGAPYYVLCAADLGNQAFAASYPEDHAYMLVRVDEQGRMLTFVTIPSVLAMEFPDGEMRTLEEACDSQSDGDIIRAIAAFAGVGITDFIATDASEIFGMVELVGGVDVDVTQEIDDPRAGRIVIDAGAQSLDAERALTFIRATNLQGGFESTARNRVAFTKALLSRALDASGLGFANVVSDASSHIETNLTTAELLSAGETLRPFDEFAVLECVTPYTTTKSVRDDSLVNSLSKSEWAAMMEAVRTTGDPGTIGSNAVTVNESDVTVEVRNGTSINGAAASLANMLTQLGYQITGTGNTGDGITYPETLVVYTDKSYEDAAKAIVREVGIGRVVNGGDFYASDAGVIAIVGADWAQ